MIPPGLDHLSEMILKPFTIQGGTDFSAGQELASNHIADILGQFMALARDDPGSHGHPEPKNTPGPERPKEHTDGNPVGQITDKGANQRWSRIGGSDKYFR